MGATRAFMYRVVWLYQKRIKTRVRGLKTKIEKWAKRVAEITEITGD